MDQHDNNVVQALPEPITVQVCYATATRVFLRDVLVPPGTTIRQAITLSTLLEEVKGIDLAVCQVGIYGKKKTGETVLREHDRVEVYRPLLADPKETRRRRAGVKVSSTPR